MQAIPENMLFYIYDGDAVNRSYQNTAYALMKSAGYTVVSRGECLHLISCIPVNVHVRSTTECYHEFLVPFLNQSYFMDPINHVLTSNGPELQCSGM